MKRIIVVGGGFAGMWSAVSAARKLHELQIDSHQVEVILINKDAYLGIRPRFYEKNPQNTRISLTNLLDLAGVRFIEGEVTGMDGGSQKVSVKQNDLVEQYTFDRLILASGSQVVGPNIQGLNAFAFSTDTYQEAMKLENHIQRLPKTSNHEGKYTAIIIGGGFTGLEVATEMIERLKDIALIENKEHEVRVIIIEKSQSVSSGFSREAQKIIDTALLDINVEVLCNQSVIEIGERGVRLDAGEIIPSLTVIWTAGVMASPLSSFVPVEKDHFGRLPVDSFLKVKGVSSIFAAGDIAAAYTDSEHITMMSCQHAIPMGKVAGLNTVCDLLEIPGIPFQKPDYVTCLDLGRWGALYTTGWERIPVYQGEKGKQLKNMIMEKINPQVYTDRNSLFKASYI